MIVLRKRDKRAIAVLAAVALAAGVVMMWV